MGELKVNQSERIFAEMAEGDGEVKENFVIVPPKSF